MERAREWRGDLRKSVYLSEPTYASAARISAESTHGPPTVASPIMGYAQLVWSRRVRRFAQSSALSGAWP